MQNADEIFLDTIYNESFQLVESNFIRVAARATI